MSYIDYYLKSPDEETARQAARQTDIGLLRQDDDGNEVWSGFSYSLKTYIVTGIPVWEVEPNVETDDETGEVTKVQEGKFEDGFFANLRVKDDPESKSEFDTLIQEAQKLGVEIKNPQTPQRTFF